ncbi:hypothetical protein [Spirosoma flavum]|uniref:DUF4390 domain-containing protein n=1 Tax=Spirosoma flavum TaxID=2048557 RepID=A0ABW6AL92_9BACT
MRLFYSFIIWVTLLTPGALTSQRKVMFATSDVSIRTSVPIADSLQAGQVVLAFLSWYKTHMQAINRRPLINQPVGKPYSVNLKNGEYYLAYLKSSHLLSDTYLNQWRIYFKEHNKSFRLNPQDEGPPDGFEFDLVLQSQDVEKQLASLKSMKINKVTIVRNQATVALTLLGAYEFRLVRQSNHLVINEILNIGQE